MMIGTVGDKWIIGLCFENLDRLRSGQPIHIRPDVHKVPFELLIHAEPTMGDLQALGERLAETGLTPDDDAANRPGGSATAGSVPKEETNAEEV